MQLIRLVIFFTEYKQYVQRGFRWGGIPTCSLEPWTPPPLALATGSTCLVFIGSRKRGAL